MELSPNTIGAYVAVVIVLLGMIVLVWPVAWIAWRSIQQRGLSSILTALSMALGVALAVAVLLVVGIVDESFRTNSSLGYNMIVGAKGGDLEMVLNSVYYLGRPVENIPYSFYQEFLPKEQRAEELGEEVSKQKDGRYAGYIALAIPICMGDYYKHYRVVGTTTRMFDDFIYDFDRERKYEFAQGRNFERFNAEHGFFEAVVGARVAQEQKLQLGDTFSPSHGAQGGDEHADKFTIVGILRPTGTPIDRAAFVNIEGFYLLDNHERVPLEGEEGAPAPGNPAAARPKAGPLKPLPIEGREVTTILVRTANDLVSMSLVKLINKGKFARAVLPVREINNLFDFIVGPIRLLLLALTLMICLVAGLSILVSIYNSMSERRQEIAVMRALGASRTTISRIVLTESTLLSLGGGLGGWILGHALIGLLAGWIEAYTGVQVSMFALSPALAIPLGEGIIDLGVSTEILFVPGLIVLGALVGFLPAFSAYQVDVARSLAP